MTKPDLKIQEPTLPPLPAITQEYIDKVFEEVSEMQIALDQSL